MVRHSGGWLEAADALLDEGEESFAAWPARCPLRSRDVAHDIAVREYLLAVEALFVHPAMDV